MGYFKKDICLEFYYKKNKREGCEDKEDNEGHEQTRNSKSNKGLVNEGHVVKGNATNGGQSICALLTCEQCLGSWPFDSLSLLPSCMHGMNQ